MFIAGNWKMHKSPGESTAFCAALRERLSDIGGVRVAVAPPFPSLAAALAELETSQIAVYAQNVHWEAEGAFTGEVSAPMLSEVGAAGAIVGHSERRQHFGETDASTGRRAAAALANNLEVIACVGELEEEREAGETKAVLERQVTAVAEAVSGEHESLVIAYEPVWAIGTGRTATPDIAQDAHAFIKELLSVPVLYGGSVKPDNAAELLSQPDIDGALVGGASLDVESFAAICAAAPIPS